MYGGVFLYEQLTDLRILRNAWDKVFANHGAPGVDGMTADAFKANQENNLLLLAGELQGNTYQPLPVLEFEINESVKKRTLGIPCIRDRIVQEAMAEILEPILEPLFADCSYAYRPHRSAKMAINQIADELKKGYLWVAETDIQKFFDSIDHELLINDLSKYIDDFPFLQLIKTSLESGAVTSTSSDFHQTLQGVIQGSPLSPILANLFLHSIDLSMEKEKYRYYRYADDIVILCQSEVEAYQSLERLRSLLKEKRLQLKEEKTKVINTSAGFVFLGYQFNCSGISVPVEAFQVLLEKLNKTANEY